MISVIMPVYNASRTVIYSVDSVLKQTYHDLEMILVDDCSTDGSYDLCREHYKNDSRVKVIRQEKNSGPAAARNKGIELARGEYVTFLDSDDGMLPETLELFAKAAAEYDADVVHTVGNLIPVAAPTPDDIMSVPAERLLTNVADTDAPSAVTVIGSDIHDRIDGFLSGRYKGNVWGKLFRKSFLTENGITFSHLKMSEDTIFSLECLLKSKTYVQIPECLIIYRMFGESLSRGKKTAAFFAKILDATLGGNEVICEKLSGIPYITENPSELTRIFTYVADAMENVYVRPAYRIVGREAIEADENICRIWEKYFGGNAVLLKKTFYDAHDNYPPVPDYFSENDFYSQCEEALKARNASKEGGCS